jgi:signal transduction histidine kinase
LPLRRVLLKNLEKERIVTVLLVDDDEDDYVVFRDMLAEIKHWKVSLHWASSFEGAIEAAKCGGHDICFMDYRLDRGTGLELMQELQKNGFASPVIVLTGQGDHQVDIRAMQEGAADYLEKGQVNAGLLEHTIRYAMERACNLKALRQSEKQLRILSSKLMNAQENERKALAHELHDSIGSSLTAVKLGLQNELGRTKQTGGVLDETTMEQLVSTVDTAIKDLKRIYGNLRPLIIDDLGVIPAIRSLTRQFEQVFPKAKCAWSLEVREEEIPDNLKIVIYRVIQEALNNVSKHSRADTVKLSLTMLKTGGLLLLIRDDGSGLDLREILSEESCRDKIGLESMKERVEMSGGSFTLLSSRGKGTTIRALWPLSVDSDQ